MLNLKLTFSNIDYEQTLRALFPLLLARLNGMESALFPVRLLQRVGEKSEKALLDILNRLPDQQKNEILQFVFRMNKERIIKSLKEFLPNHPYAQHISFETAYLCMEAQDDIALYLQDVSINYYALSRYIPALKKAQDRLFPEDAKKQLGETFGEKAVGYAALAAGALMNLGAGDAALLRFLKKDENMHFVMNTLENMLRSSGIFARLTACEVVKSRQGIPEEILREDQNARMPEALIESLLDVLSGYIADLIDRCE